jgi:hypothetical protein
MFFVDLSLGPSGIALLSQLVCARVELMLTRAAVLRDRGLLPEVTRVGTQSVIDSISNRSLPSFCFVTLGCVYLCLQLIQQLELLERTLALPEVRHAEQSYCLLHHIFF